MSVSLSSEHNILVLQGATWRELFTYKINTYDEDGNFVSAEAADLSGYTAKGQVRAIANVDSPVLGEMSFDMSGAAEGKVLAILSSGQTAGIGENAVYDIRLTGADVIRLVSGRVIVSRAVTYDD